jgi:hypothetical protein
MHGLMLLLRLLQCGWPIPGNLAQVFGLQLESRAHFIIGTKELCRELLR